MIAPHVERRAHGRKGAILHRCARCAAAWLTVDGKHLGAQVEPGCVTLPAEGADEATEGLPPDGSYPNPAGALVE